MERYVDLAERSLVGAGDLRALAERLDAMDRTLASLDARLAGIERHLGLAPSRPAVPASVEPNAPGISDDATPVPSAPSGRP